MRSAAIARRAWSNSASGTTISVDSAADVAKEAADLVLLDHDLSVLHEGVMQGRQTVENVTKYILMGSSSNLGNMVSMAGAALFLPFLPMLPTQVLLNKVETLITLLRGAWFLHLIVQYLTPLLVQLSDQLKRSSDIMSSK